MKANKIIPFPKSPAVEPEPRHRTEAEQIGEAWQRILGVTLDAEQTARHLAQLERWQNKKIEQA